MFLSPTEKMKCRATGSNPDQVATVVRKLAANVKAQHATADWGGIARMRKLVAHHDNKINDDLLWQALTVRIPNLIQELGL